jgi:hypothetical protein
MKVFRNGFLDVIDDVFWMLPFSSVRQAQLVFQDHNITMDDWTKRRERIMQEHHKDGAREQLAATWKSWVASDSEGFRERRLATAESQQLSQRLLSAMNDPKVERPWVWRGQAVESWALPASCHAIFKSLTDTI